MPQPDTAELVKADASRSRAGPPTAAPPRASLPALLRPLAAMTATMAFRQAASFVAVVVAAGAVILWLLYVHTTDLMSRQLVETMSVEAEGLADLGRAAGPLAIVEAVKARAAAGSVGGRLYLVIGPRGNTLAGNLPQWPDEIATDASGGTFAYQGGPDTRRLAAGVALRLPGDLRLLVARDLDEQRQLAARVKWLFLGGFGALALAGLGAGLLASRLALRRLASITRTSDAIMAGDFSGRIPLSGAGDELDHLSGNLNAMLDRIEQLMAGLREVSDNIAHDLKTPLNRLRSRAEAALREAKDPGAAHAALGQVIEDADELIKTFNALLLIARLEAGALQDTAEMFDVSALARDVAELYAPVAEEAGLSLSCDAADGIMLRANRQLVGQAIANLIDNAIKYGRPAAGGPASIEARVEVNGGEVSISVADHGPGIPAADRERVLKRFVRLEASRTRPGPGLGLSLVAAVARLQGGRVLLEDNAPGLRIVLVVPARV